MTLYIILVRNPRNNRVLAITDGADDSDDPKIATFPSMREAHEAADKIALCQAWPCEVVKAP